MKKPILKYLLFLACFLAAINSSFAQNDSIVLTYDGFIQNVLTHHPISQQTDLQSNFAEARWLSARGRFDTQLKSNWNEKQFDDKQYYQIFEAGFQIPTWYGLTLKGGYENTEGVFLNPENKTDKNGLWAVGIEANLLQGLLIDERRAALQQAEVFQRATENHRKLLLNDLLFDASAAYFNWQVAFFTQQIIEESLDLAEEYLEATRQLFLNGDKPAIDTLEAFLIVQDRLNLLQSNEINLVSAKQFLENYLWYDGIPVELQATTLPEDFNQTNIDLPIDVPLQQLIANHPEILEKELKVSQYEIEGRVKRDKLKPKLKVKYNPLLSTTENSISPNFSTSNFKWGFDFSMPLQRRSERAAIAENQLKIRETELSITDKRNVLQNKLDATLAKQNLLEQQVTLQTQNVGNYQTLLDAETTKFSFGESSVFLLNKRQEKFLDGNIKLLQLRAKLQMNKVEYLYFTGSILEVLNE